VRNSDREETIKVKNISQSVISAAVIRFMNDSDIEQFCEKILAGEIVVGCTVGPGQSDD
jgi:hypothetical protein